MTAAAGVSYLCWRQQQAGEPRVDSAQVFDKVLAVDVHVQGDNLADCFERAPARAALERGYAVVNAAARFVLALRESLDHSRIVGNALVGRTGLAGVG